MDWRAHDIRICYNGNSAQDMRPVGRHGILSFGHFDRVDGGGKCRLVL